MFLSMRLNSLFLAYQFFLLCHSNILDSKCTSCFFLSSVVSIFQAVHLFTFSWRTFCVNWSFIIPD